MRYNEAVKELQYNRNKRFILFGEESYLKDSFIRMALNAHPDSGSFSYYPGEESEAQSTLFSSSLFDEDQIVILNYYDEMKTKGFKEIIQKYKGYIFLVLSPEANIKTAVLTEISSLCLQVQCSKMSEYTPEYPSWLVSKAAEKGYTFVEDAETLLYKKVGPDMASLSRELEKLMIYKEQSKSIVPIDIDKVVSFSVLTSNYDILDALLRKDIPKALTTFDSYIKNSDDLDGLVSFFGYFFEKLYRMLLLKADKVSPEGMSSILNISPYLIKSKYLSRANSLGLARLSQILDQIVGLEVGLRTSSIKEILIYKFIFSFV
jgi:DNA polymerase-3 subunit delta